MNAGARRIEEALDRAIAVGRPAIAAFLTAGYPTRERFVRHLEAVAAASDIVEVGVPFSDPMADGVTIQRASRSALESGITLDEILTTVAAVPAHAPILLMSYLNPLLAFGPAKLAKRAADSGISGFIVPDLPLEEQALLAEPFADGGLALIQLVTPATPPARMQRIASNARGFLYAVAMNGTTGGSASAHPDISHYLARVKATAACPVLAGFGVRRRADVEALVPPADGVVVGSALIEAIERGADPAAFLEALR
jgi:tryptophan synthase alpha chain